MKQILLWPKKDLWYEMTPQRSCKFVYLQVKLVQAPLTDCFILAESTEDFINMMQKNKNKYSLCF